LSNLPKKLKPSLEVFVALLRGVNVGGKNMISMSSLKSSFERMGFTQVTTYINSGNIIFKSKERDPRKLEKKLERMLANEYDLENRVVVRTLSEMEALVDSLPASWNNDLQWRYNVIFLRHTIDSKEILSGLGPKSDIEQVVYRKGTLLWSARVTDVARTSMVKLSSKKIFQDMTVRNVNTTRKLRDLMTKIANRSSS
jgi:uncharacterized protein (DUF1697 family)